MPEFSKYKLDMLYGAKKCFIEVLELTEKKSAKLQPILLELEQEIEAIHLAMLRKKQYSTAKKMAAGLAAVGLFALVESSFEETAELNHVLSCR